MNLPVEIISLPSLIALASASALLLEEFGFFQKLKPETKRLIALLVAGGIALGVAQLEHLAQSKGDASAFYVVLSALAQQLVHAWTKRE
jgi:hypothetical protein